MTTLLNETKVAVVVTDQSSQPQDTITGDPQDRFLCPIICSCFINYLSSLIMSELGMFVHVCTMNISLVNEADYLQVDDMALEVKAQLDKIAKAAFGMLAFISKKIEYMSWNVTLQPYKLLVRPHKAYCVHIQSEH